MMLKRTTGRGEAGEGKIGLIIAILLIVGAIYVMKLMIPPRITEAELADYAEQRARLFVLNQATMEQLILGIQEEAGKKGIALKEDDIQIIDGESMVKVIIKYDFDQTLIGGKVYTQHHEIEREVQRL